MKISQLFYYSRYAILLTLLLGFMGFKVTGFSFFYFDDYVCCFDVTF
ncbi:hypothetical protein [Holzapfeliella floricola]|nr:hypothetical protein [Holzapfeliella floricola]